MKLDIDKLTWKRLTNNRLRILLDYVYWTYHQRTVDWEEYYELKEIILKWKTKDKYYDFELFLREKIREINDEKECDFYSRFYRNIRYANDRIKQNTYKQFFNWRIIHEDKDGNREVKGEGKQ